MAKIIHAGSCFRHNSLASFLSKAIKKQERLYRNKNQHYMFQKKKNINLISKILKSFKLNHKSPLKQEGNIIKERNEEGEIV